MIQSLSLRVVDHLPSDYAGLIWETFFVARGRGWSLERHFPWLLDPNSNAWFVTARDGDRLIAGLTCKPLTDGTQAIGLLCVVPEERGGVVGRLVMDEGAREADRRGVLATVLWAARPRAYQRHGFRLQDDSEEVEVDGWHSGSDAGLSVQAWPDTKEAMGLNRGLPPFATAARRISSPGAEIIVVTDPHGELLAEWRGTDDDILALLRASMPGRWRCRLKPSDRCKTMLTAAGALVTCLPLPQAMWRLHPTHGSIHRLPDLQLLDRI